MAADGSRQVDDSHAKLRQIADALVREIRNLLLKLDTERGSSDLVSDKEALANATRIHGQVVRVMEEQGVRAIQDEAEAEALALAEEMSSEIDLGEFDPDVSRDLESIVSGQMDDVAKAFEDGSREIAQAVRTSIVGGSPIDALIDEVAQAIETTTQRAQSAVDAAIMGVGRRVQVEDAKVAQDALNGDDKIVMLYVGPNDSKKRDFCADLLGKAVRLDDMDRLDNGTDLEAKTFGGGYGCRDSWAAMLESEAISQGIEIVEP